MTLGRAPASTVPIDDPEMALQHAVIEHRTDGLRIRDLGTMNRILVNGHEVRESRLRHGDEVELGRTRFLVQALVQSDVGQAPGRAGVSKRVKRVLRDVGVVLVIAGIVAYIRLPRAKPEAPPVVEEEVLLPEMPAPRTTVPPAVVPDERAEWNIEGLEKIASQVEVAHGVNTGVASGTTATTLPSPPVSEPPVSVGTGASAGTAVTRPPPTTTTTMPPPAVVSAPPPAVDPVMARITKTLEDARRKIAVGEYVQADRLLDGISILAPDYLPAYAERARLFERRDMPERAMEQWLEIVERGDSGALYDTALKEFDRLRGKVPPPPAPELNRVRIASLDQRKFQETDEYLEMRVVDVGVAAVRTGDQPDAEATRVEVQFFDEHPATGAIRPTRALVSVTPLKPEGGWRSGETKTTSATYVVQKKATTPRTDPRGGDRFYGYLVRIFYRGALQDQDARPKSLLEMKQRSDAPAGAPASRSRGSAAGR